MTHDMGADRAAVLRASAIGLALGTALAVIAVLPAEFGIDPTGAGAALGLLKLSRPATVAAPELPAALTAPLDAARVSRVTREIGLEPGQGIEFKVIMEEGAVASFRWIASGPLHFDQHGEPEGDTSGYFESYALGEGDALEGKFTALFTGTHGWYWRNDGAEAVRIDLTVAGDFVLKTDG
jgi:hypothetical protein